MKKLNPVSIPALVVGVLLTWNSFSRAAVIFSEDFNGYVNGTQNANQVDSGLLLSVAGDLPGWSKEGGGVVYAVNLNGRGNMAAMIWADNVLTLATGVEANDIGIVYTVDFIAGPTVYSGSVQQTGPAEGLVIDVLRADDSVLATFTHLPGAWTGAQTMSPGRFVYAGDGSGEVRLRVGPLLRETRFNGAIDDLKVTRGALLFGENFNGFLNGAQNARQADSGLLLSFGGDLPGWEKAGSGVVHVVDRDAKGDFAVLIWQDNVITKSSGVAVNDVGTIYSVEFLAGPAVYSDTIQASGPEEGLVIDVVRVDASVLATHTYRPGAWAGAATFTPVGFDYTGDGSGDVRFRVGPRVMGGRFNGAIDDFTVAIGGALPVPTIVGQPSGGTAEQYGTFAFSVVATGNPSFQWFKNGSPIGDATSATYTIGNVALSDAGSYRVTLSNSAGMATSDSAELTVTPAPVFSGYREAVLAANPIHYYPLDDTGGTMALDLGSLATVGGTYRGGFELGAAAPRPALGTSVQLDGEPGSFVDLGLFHPGDAITVEAWVLLDQTAQFSWNAIVARWGFTSDDGSYEMAIDSSDVPGIAVLNGSGTVGQVFAAGPVPRNQWRHVVGIFSAGTLSIYVNGVPGAMQSIGGVLRDAGTIPDRVMIGATRDGEGGAAFNFKGLIDEVAIYDYPLSAAQIRGHFQVAQPGVPMVSIQRAIELSWPAFPPDFELFAAPDPSGPYEPVLATPRLEEGMYKLTVPTTGLETLYYQLMGP